MHAGEEPERIYSGETSRMRVSTAQQRLLLRREDVVSGGRAVRQVGRELRSDRHTDEARVRWIARALKTHPDSVDTWLHLIQHAEGLNAARLTSATSWWKTRDDRLSARAGCDCGIFSTCLLTPLPLNLFVCQGPMHTAISTRLEDTARFEPAGAFHGLSFVQHDEPPSVICSSYLAASPALSETVIRRTSAADQLPVELLLECLQLADPPTRVRASLVSQRWRAVALSDARLWASFSCTIFRHQWHQDAMLDKLEAMLQRSRSLPFRLRIPHRYHGVVFVYVYRLLHLEHLDVHRLVLYDGPMDVFCQLLLDQTSLPTLSSLNFIEPKVQWEHTTIELPGGLSGSSFPNLQTLEAPFVRFSPDGRSFPSVQHFTCSLDDGTRHLERLFQVFPNLLHLRVNAIAPSIWLPPVPQPASLRTLVLRPLPRFELDINWTLRDWEGVPVPKLVGREAGTARGVLWLFAAMHPHPVHLRLNGGDGEIVLSTPGDEFTWTITPSHKSCWTFLNALALETSRCDRLTSISVGMDSEQLGRFFGALFHVPELAHLEFRLEGTQDWPVLHAHDSFVVHAPRLQHVVFNANGRMDAICDRTHMIQSVLAVLRSSFRDLIIYDADMLESITVSAPAECTQRLDFASLASFAKEYCVCETE